METSITKSVLAEKQENSYELTLSGTAREIVETLNTLKIPFSELETHLSEDDKRDLINVKNTIDEESKEKSKFEHDMERVIFNTTCKWNDAHYTLMNCNTLNNLLHTAYINGGVENKFKALKIILKENPQNAIFISSIPYCVQEFLVLEDWKNIQYIMNPYDGIIDIAKSINPKAVKLVKFSKDN